MWGWGGEKRESLKEVFLQLAQAFAIKKFKVLFGEKIRYRKEGGKSSGRGSVFMEKTQRQKSWGKGGGRGAELPLSGQVV